MPYPYVLITNSFGYHRAFAVPILIHAGKRLGAVRPLPMAAVQRSHTPRQSPLRIALQNTLQLGQGGHTQIIRTKLIHNKT